uniref:Uncharacterized protein n=1 Tax=Anguilla anguilla TaxID=7936 RepID=A0A0E9QWF3_ANGAN
MKNAKSITSSNKSYETQYRIIHELHISPSICCKYDTVFLSLSFFATVSVK